MYLIGKKNLCSCCQTASCHLFGSFKLSVNVFHGLLSRGKVQTVESRSLRNDPKLFQGLRWSVGVQGWSGWSGGVQGWSADH